MTKKSEIVTDIILVDIVSFSKLSSSQQLELVTFLTKSYKKMLDKMFAHLKIPLDMLVLGFVSTGDGFYCILDPKLRGYGIFLGLSFNHFSEHIAKKFPFFQGLHIAVHTGGVNKFTDILGHENFIGDGLNECARYIEFKNFAISTVIVSESAYKEFQKFLTYHKDFEKVLLERGFQHSREYIFDDKHAVQRKACLVWLRNSGIITPPKIDF